MWIPPKNCSSILNITWPEVIQGILSKKLKFDLKNGNFPGKLESQTYLRNTKYEFEYMEQRVFNLKTSIQ